MLGKGLLSSQNRIGRLRLRFGFLLSVFMMGLLSPLLEAQLRMPFTMKVPEPRTYWTSAAVDWLTPSLGPSPAKIRVFASPEAEHASEVDHRLIVHVVPETDLSDLESFLNGMPLKPLAHASTYLLETISPVDALLWGERLSTRADIVAAYPVESKPFKPRKAYASVPDDPFFEYQWYLDQRDAKGQKLGLDLNLRAAWPVSGGNGVGVAIVDTGVGLLHPDLEEAFSASENHNFISGEDDGEPVSSSMFHGTAVAGLIGAVHDNQEGIAGILPGASLSSWVIFGLGGGIADSLQLAEMYEYRPERIAIQNHSWGNAFAQQEGPSFIERSAISNAFYQGRSGKGTIMVRAAGNDRIRGDFHPGLGDVNDDGYTSMHQSIAVAATDRQGKATTYSNRGACILVAAPGGESDDGLFTTDLLGRQGYTTSTRGLGEGDYIPNEIGFIGTSAAAPLVSGMAGLALGVNPNLSNRDVQQLLIASARQVFEDPDTVANGAGFAHNHNVGFGIPDAGELVQLASQWHTRDPLVVKSFSTQPLVMIPDAGLRLKVEGVTVPDHLKNIVASTTMGLQPDRPTNLLPMSDEGMVVAAIAKDLTGKGAMIQRGTATFERKIQHAADAGAEFVVIYNNVDEAELIRMAGTDYSPIPAYFISNADGDELVQLMKRDPKLRMQLSMESVEHVFEVSDDMICEHVELIVDADHSFRGQLRITLESPSGTISVLQRLNHDDSRGPIRWAYRTTRHFFEPTAGTWKVRITDQDPDEIGTLRALRLSLMGTPIEDVDNDGLDDSWERRHFGNLRASGFEDSDADGASNAREQLLQTHPKVSNHLFRMELLPMDEDQLQLQWASLPGHVYEVMGLSGLGRTPKILGTVQAHGRYAEWMIKVDPTDQAFFQIVDRGMP